MLVFTILSSFWLLTHAGNYRYNTFATPSSPLDNSIHYLIHEMRRELTETREEIKTQLQNIQYEINTELQNLRDELKAATASLTKRLDKQSNGQDQQNKRQKSSSNIPGVVPSFVESRNDDGAGNRHNSRRNDDWLHNVRKTGDRTRKGDRRYDDSIPSSHRDEYDRLDDGNRHGIHTQVSQTSVHDSKAPENPTSQWYDQRVQEEKMLEEKKRHWGSHHITPKHHEEEGVHHTTGGSSRITSEVQNLKKKLKKSIKGLVEQSEEIKNELRSQKAEMFAIRNSVYDSKEELQAKGDLVLRNLRSTNGTFICYLNDLRMYLFKINSNFKVLKRDQERMKDLIFMSSSFENEDYLTTEEPNEEEGEGDTLFGQTKYLPGCTPNPLETQETLNTFGPGPVFNNYTFPAPKRKEYFPIDSSKNKSKGKSKNPGRGDVASLFPPVPENCLDPQKIYLEYPPMPRDCRDVYELGFMESGVYRIQPPGLDGREVFCEHQSTGGGWTVVVNRRKVPRHIQFNRTWHEYENGFGDPTREYWIGLKTLHVLTKDHPHQLRADLEDWDGNQAWASYNYFTVSGPEDKYRLRVSGYTGNAGDSMRHSHLQMFSTVDQDNDQEDWGNCARGRGGGGWWWGRCACTQPTGQYRRGKHPDTKKGVTWYHWKESNYSLKTITLMIKPRD